MDFLVLDRKCDTGNMPLHVNDFNCQKDIKQENSEKNDFDDDLYFDEELNSYLNQLEAIPIELFEENCEDSSDGSKAYKNALTERTQAASTSTSECPSTAEDADSAASISSFVAKTAFNVLPKKGQEEESKLSLATINRQMASDSGASLSIAVCAQMISRSRQKTVRADTVTNTYRKCKEQLSEEGSFSTFENPNRVTSSENSPSRTVISNFVERVSKLDGDSERTKKRRKRKERDYSKDYLSDGRTKNSVNAEKVIEESVSSTREQGGVKRQIISCMEAACRLETESPIPQKESCDDGNDEEDKNLISLDIIKTEHNLQRLRRDSSSSSSSFSGRETVILPLENARLPHLKGELQCTTPQKWKTCVLDRSSSSESLFHSGDSICVISEREPSPFPISKAISDVASCQIESNVIETKSDIAVPKADCFKSTSDCTKISSETCKSDPILAPKRNKYGLLKEIQFKSSDLQRQSSSPPLSLTTESQLNSQICKGECKVLQPKAVARRQGSRTPSPCCASGITASDPSTLRHKSLSPLPPRYSGSAFYHGMFHKSRISPILVSTEQQTDKQVTPTDSRSHCSAKAEVESSKPKDKLHGPELVQGTKFFTLKHNKSTSISPERHTVNSKSMSPVSSSSSYSPVKKRSRSRTEDSKSMSPVSSSSSYSPVKRKSRSRTVDCKSMSPVSSSNSYSPVRKRSRSRTVDSKSMSPVNSSSSYSPVKRRSRSRTADCKSMSPVSNSSSYSPVRKRYRSRTQRRSSKSQSRSPLKYRRQSRSMSPWRRRWKNQRSHSRSVSPPKWQSRSRSPWRRRTRSRSRVITRYCRSRSRGRKSHSPRRGSRSPRKDSQSRRSSRSRRRSRSRRDSRSPRIGSRSPRRGSRSPRRYSRSPRRYSRSLRRYSRSPRRYSRSPRRVSRKRRRRSSSMSISPPSAAEKRMRLKEKTETAICSIVAALNGTRTTATAVSVTQRQKASAASTVSSVPSGALPVVQLTQVQ
jgi:hypothetical protein